MPVSPSQDEMVKLPFTSRYKSLMEVMRDQELAALGDAYVNFIFSLASSKRLDKPTGGKVQSWVLANALKRADLRRTLPQRVDRHEQADAVEALLVYAWLRGLVNIEECVVVLESAPTSEEGFSMLLRTVLVRITF